MLASKPPPRPLLLLIGPCPTGRVLCDEVGCAPPPSPPSFATWVEGRWREHRRALPSRFLSCKVGSAEVAPRLGSV